MAPVTARSTERIPALDGVRGLSILSVVIGHTEGLFPAVAHWPARWLYGVNWPGVDSFFVLSGFLITGLLLDARGTGDRPPRGYFSSFYARRVLRIFPVYYLYLAWLMLVRHLPMPAGDWGYYWTYTTNILFLRGGGEAVETGPLWSLAVEEQFYILWPLVIAITPRRYFRAVCWTLIATGGILAFTLTLGGHIPAEYMFIRMDELSLGGLVASYVRDETTAAPSPRTLAWVFALFVLCLIAAHKSASHQLWYLAESRAAAVVTAITIALVVGDRAHPLSRALSARPLRSWGTYSYAIYIMHMSVAVPVMRVIRARLPASATQPLAAIVATLCVCWVAGWLSYHIIERPMLSLKRFVPMPTMIAARMSA